MHTSWVARIALGVAALAVAAFAGMPLLVRLGWLPGALGFQIFMLGALLGAVALLLGVLALWTTRQASGRSGRGAALFATAAGLVIVGVVGVAAGPAVELPVINDISTDLEDPPVFRALAELPANAGRNMTHPGADFARQQRSGYPDLAPIELEQPPRAAFANAVAAVESLGWEIVRKDPALGEIEATDTSATFHFVDDVAVRVRANGAGSVVDVRSKSRDGKGDLGANAARIRALRAALR